MIFSLYHFNAKKSHNTIHSTKALSSCNISIKFVLFLHITFTLTVSYHDPTVTTYKFRSNLNKLYCIATFIFVHSHIRFKEFTKIN